MTVVCLRCGNANEVTGSRKDALCGNCYGPLDETEAKQADAYDTELAKLHPLTKSYGNKDD